MVWVSIDKLAYLFVTTVSPPHRYYPCYEFTNKFKPDVPSVKRKLSLFSMFYGCIYSTSFWSQKSLSIWESHKILMPITEGMVLFLNVESDNFEVNNVMKLLCLLGKYHIHKSRFVSMVTIFLCTLPRGACHSQLAGRTLHTTGGTKY